MPVSSNLRPTTIPTLTLPVVLWVITVIKAPGPPLCVPASVRAVQSVSRQAGLCAVWLIITTPLATSDCTAQQGTVLFWVSLHPIHLLPLIASPRTQSQPWVVSCRTFPGALAHQRCFLPPCSLGYLIHVCNCGAQGAVNSAPRFPAPQSTDSVSLLPLLMLEAQ